MQRFRAWFKGLSTKAKWLVIGGAITAPLVVLGAANPAPTPPPAPPAHVETKTVTETASIPCGHSTVQDAALAKGKTETRQACVNGEKTQTYKVTYTNGAQTKKELVSETTTKEAVDEIVAEGTYVAPAPPVAKAPATQCDPNYKPCLVYHGGADYDCASGSGNGPYYATGPIYVIGTDVYGLDRNGDGVACE